MHNIYSNDKFKDQYQEYLKHKNEPKENILYDEAAAELNAGLIKTSFFQKRKFRREARRLRYEF